MNYELWELQLAINVSVVGFNLQKSNDAKDTATHKTV